MDHLNKNLNCDNIMNSDLWMYALSFLNAVCPHTVHQEKQSFELQIFSLIMQVAWTSEGVLTWKAS